MTMRIKTCAYCGKTRLRVAASYSYPKGNDILLQSDKFPTVFLHSNCMWNMRTKLRDILGREDLLESPFWQEIRSEWTAEELKNA